MHPNAELSSRTPEEGIRQKKQTPKYSSEVNRPMYTRTSDKQLRTVVEMYHQNGATQGGRNQTHILYTRRQHRPGCQVKRTPGVVVMTELRPLEWMTTHQKKLRTIALNYQKLQQTLREPFSHYSSEPHRQTIISFSGWHNKTSTAPAAMIINWRHNKQQNNTTSPPSYTTPK